MAWTEERVEILIRLWGENCTAGEIGKVLGVTRNAVIGKAYRLGMSKKRNAPKEDEEPLGDTEGQETGEANEVAKQDDGETALLDQVPAPETEDADTLSGEQDTEQTPEDDLPSAQTAEQNARKITLMELTERTCKWPFGDPATDDFWFCGQPSTPGKPYCEPHNKIAAQPFTTRRDRKPGRRPLLPTFGAR